MTSAPSVPFRRTLVVGGVAAALAFGAVAPATAADIVEGDTPVVLSDDQSTFGEITEVFPAPQEAGISGEIEVLLFGGPSSPEITVAQTTALSFDAENRVFVALLTAGQFSGESFEYLCAIRLYDEDGVPLGGPVPIMNPDGGGELGVWPSSCEGLALLDVLSAYGLDLQMEGGFSTDAAAPTDALVFFENGDSARIDARTGDVLEFTPGAAEGFDLYESVAISAGPAALLDPDREGVAIIAAAFFDDVVVVSVLYDNGDVDSIVGFFPLQVDGAEFDSELNLWVVSSNLEEGESVALSFEYTDLLEFGVLPDGQLQPGAEVFSVPDEFADVSSTQGTSGASFEAAAVSGGVLVSDLGSFEAGGIAVVRDAIQLASDDAEPELANTGPNDELLLTLGIIAGAIVIAGVVFTAVGASRRRASRD